MRQYVLAFAAGAMYCTPLLEAELVLSVEGQTLDTTRLHVRGRQHCGGDSAPPSPPPPGLDEDPDGTGTIVVPFWQTGTTFRTSLHSHDCDVAFTAWYDTNGDKLVGRGDYTGTVPAFSLNSGCRSSKRVELPLDLVR